MKYNSVDIASIMGVVAGALSFIFQIVVMSIIGVDFNDNNTTWSSILSLIEFVLAIFFAAVIVIMSDFLFTKCPRKPDRPTLKIGCILLAIIWVGSMVITSVRFIETGIVLEYGLCSRDFCPTTIFRRLNNSKTCNFNAFAKDSDAWRFSENPLDWSDRNTYYDKEMLVAAKNPELEGENETVSTIQTYQECWHWGCDSLCNANYTINRVAVFYSLGLSIIYFVSFITLTISLLTIKPNKKAVAIEENPPDEPEEPDPESDPPAPDEEDEDKDISEVDNVDDILYKQLRFRNIGKILEF